MSHKNARKLRTHLINPEESDEQPSHQPSQHLSQSLSSGAPLSAGAEHTKAVTLAVETGAADVGAVGGVGEVGRVSTEFSSNGARSALDYFTRVRQHRAEATALAEPMKPRPVDYEKSFTLSESKEESEEESEDDEEAEREVRAHAEGGWMYGDSKVVNWVNRNPKASEWDPITTYEKAPRDTVPSELSFSSHNKAHWNYNPMAEINYRNLMWEIETILNENPITQQEKDFYKQLGEFAESSDERNVQFLDEPPAVVYYRPSPPLSSYYTTSSSSRSQGSQGSKLSSGCSVPTAPTDGLGQLESFDVAFSEANPHPQAEDEFGTAGGAQAAVAPTSPN